MPHSLKSSSEYLSQFKKDQDDKSGMWINEITSSLQGKKKVFKLLEVGPGSGYSIKYLKKQFGDNLEITAVDKYPEIIKDLKKMHKITAIMANISNLPFKDDSFDGINASSVFHEIYSYGLENNGKKIEGIEAVITVFAELARVLKPEGLLYYRDVLSPHMPSNFEKKVRYRNNAWKYFINWFLPVFTKSKRDNVSKVVKITDHKQGITLTAPTTLHKEIQKHYINFAHFIKYTASSDLGFTVKKLNKYNLPKKRNFSITFSNPELEKLFLKLNSKTNKMKANSLIINRIELDNYIDLLLTNAFSNKNFEWVVEKGKFNDWLNREGRESYVYASTLELLELLENLKDKNGMTLFPTSNTDCSLHIKFKYNLYLRRVIDLPELDGNQTISLRKFKS